MPISMSCSGCQAALCLDDELAGKTVRCEKCGNVFKVQENAEPGEDIVPATLVEADDVVMARIVEPRPKPAKKPKSLAGVLILMAIGLFFLFGFVLAAAAGIGGFIFLSRDSQPVAANKPIVEQQRGENKDKDKGVKEKKGDEIKGPQAHFWVGVRFDDKDNKPGRYLDPIPPLKFQPDGKAIVLDGRIDKGVAAFAFEMQRDHRLNFSVTTSAEVDLQLHDGADVVAERQVRLPGERLAMFYMARKTGTHVLFLTMKDHGQADFELRVATPVTEPMPVKIAVGESYNGRHALHFHDTFAPISDAIHYGTAREYVVDMEAGDEWRLKIFGTELLPILRFYDPTDTFLEEHRHKPGEKQIEHVFMPKTTGQYRVRVTSAFNGLGEYNISMGRMRPAKKLVLDPNKRYPRDFDPNPLPIKGLRVHKIVNSVYTHEPLWHPDGKSLFVVQVHNYMMQLDARDFSIMKDRVFFDKDKALFFRGGLAWSGEGLLALACPLGQNGADMQLMILDDTLMPKKKIACPNASLIRTAPNLGIAFVGGRNTFPDGAQSDLYMVDLKTGERTRLDLDPALKAETFQVTLDGKYFLGTDGKSIVRFRIEGAKLIHEQTGPPHLKNDKVHLRLETSGDYVWLLGIDPQTGHTPDNVVTFLLHSKDLHKLYRGYNVRIYSAGIQPSEQTIVLSDTLDTLSVRLQAKEPPERYRWQCETPRRLFMNPRTDTALFHCGPDLYHVHWPAK